MFISLIRKPVWMLGLFLALSSTPVFGQDNQAIPPEVELQAPPPKIVEPRLESTKQPRTRYRLDEVIVYQITVKWPEPVSNVRMGSPQMSLKNLELIGVGEETVSVSDSREGDTSIEQILTLQFKALKPGPAKINSLILEWIQSDGISSSRLKIPSLELTIRKSNNPLFWISIFGSAAVIISAFFGLAYFKKKKAIPSVQPVKTAEDACLNQLDQLKNSLKSESDSKNFLNHLMRVLDQYARQKFDWNHSQEDYNALQKKADKIWDQKEIRELKELFERIEYSRFSGSELKTEELNSLFQSVRSLIERKKVLT